MSPIISEIYNALLLILWAAFLWRTLKPRYSLWITILVYLLTIPVCYFLIKYNLARLSFLRIFSMPALFTLLAFFLYRSKPLITIFAALTPQTLQILVDFLGVAFYPDLMLENGYELYWNDPFSLVITATLFVILTAALAIVNSVLTRQHYSLTAAQWTVFLMFPISQTICFALLLHQYSRTEVDTHWSVLAAVVLLFAAADGVLFRVISQAARKAELEATNRLLEDQLDSQLKHYQALTQQYENNRHIRHDISHHMHTIQLLLESSRHDEAANYAGELLRQQAHRSQLGQCDNPVVDAFLYSRIQEAQQLNIPVEASVILPAELPIPNVDLIILFGNLLDNAMESCGRSKTPFIKLDVHLRKGYLTVTSSNPAPEDARDVKKRRIPGLERGTGLPILDNLAKRYDGTCTYGERDGVFSISVILKLMIPKESGDLSCF